MAGYSLDEPDRRLELSSEEFRSCAEVAVGMIETLIDRIDRGELPTVSAIDAPALSAFAASFGEEPGPPLGAFAAELFEALGTGVNSNTGGYMADIPGGGIMLGAVASLLTTAFNRWPGLYPGAPGLIEIEKRLLCWMCALAGLPAGSGGIFTSGGSMANFNAIFAARMNTLPDRLDLGTIYYSREAHHSVPKAARMCGIGPDRMRAIATDAEFRIDPDRLLAAIEDDLAARLRPFLIVASAGTTATGAMDDLAAISRIARRYGCWLHVDAAWAGSLLLTERGRLLMHGIDRADSITIDPHKAFWTPWGAGALLVADLRHLHRAFSFDAGYMPFEDAEDLTLNPSLISSELSRCDRGLPLWLALKVCGVEAFRNGLDEKLDLADWAYGELKKSPHLEILAPPISGILCVRHRLGDGATRRIVEYVNLDPFSRISAMRIGGDLYARLAPLHFRTHRPDVARVVRRIEDAVDRERQSSSV